MLTKLLRLTFLPFCLTWALFAQADDDAFPEWLGGRPDVEIKDGRCGVYEWFFDQADSQTEAAASNDELASKRVINIANKLVDHHRTNPRDSYGAQIKYLVIGEHDPFHFTFHISSAELERIINKSCAK